MLAAVDEPSMSRRLVPIVLAVAALALAPAGAMAKAASHPSCGRPSTCATPRPSRVRSASGCRSRARRARLSNGPASACSGSTAPSVRGAWCAPGGDAGFARIGIGTRLVQGGTTFTFPLPEPGSRIVLRGLVDVEWRAGTQVVDQARMNTTAGHRDGKDRQRRVSRSSCEITR